MKYLYALLFLILMAVTVTALADNPHHGGGEDTVTNVYNVYDTYNQYDEYVTHVTEEQRVTELLTTTNVQNYTPDECQGVAIAQAGTNNQMNMGVSAPQWSVGIGECEGEVAGSLMIGVKPSKDLLINGSIAIDEDVRAFGLGIGGHF